MKPFTSTIKFIKEEKIVLLLIPLLILILICLYYAIILFINLVFAIALQVGVTSDQTYLLLTIVSIMIMIVFYIGLFGHIGCGGH